MDQGDPTHLQRLAQVVDDHDAAIKRIEARLDHPSAQPREDPGATISYGLWSAPKGGDRLKSDTFTIQSADLWPVPEREQQYEPEWWREELERLNKRARRHKVWRKRAQRLIESYEAEKKAPLAQIDALKEEIGRQQAQIETLETLVSHKKLQLKTELERNATWRRDCDTLKAENAQLRRMIGRQAPKSAAEPAETDEFDYLDRLDMTEG